MKLLKKAMAMLLAAACVFGALAMSVGAANHPDPPKKLSVELEPIRSYSESGFTDVADNWSRPVITTCYELGLMSGRGAGVFDPSGTVSVAEAVTVTARIHELSNGGDGVLPKSQPWYQSAVDYALENALISAAQFSDYTAAATRAELAGLLANVLPEADYAPINDIRELPDVSASTPYSKDIFKLYNAGVVAGSDAYGTFTPLSSITRAELSAMLCRLVQPGTRKAVDLQEKPEGPAMAYTSDKILWLDNYPIAGLVEIEGELYCPAEYLHQNRTVYPDPPLGLYVDTAKKEARTSYDYHPSYTSERDCVTPIMTALQRREIALSYPTDIVLKAGRSNTAVEKAIRVIGDHYYLLRLSAMPEEFDYTLTSDGVRLMAGQISHYEVRLETDLVGQVAPSLIRSSDRETVKAIHDYIINHMEYDTGWMNDIPNPERAAAQLAAEEKYKNRVNYMYAAGYGVCEDYAHMFMAFCQRVGIPCEYVTGYANGSYGRDGHAWNRVYVDGAWSFVDCTWDDPIGGKPRETYLFIDADRLANDHSWNGDDFPIKGDYDPAWAQLDCSNITSRDMFRKCLVAQLMQKNPSFTLRVTSADAYGGTACVYSFPGSWYTMSTRQNGNSYTFTVSYY